jgi:arsenite methyltransferase
MKQEIPVDADQLREAVKDKYREVAIEPYATYHFHTGRPLAKRLGYDGDVVGAMPDQAVESFAGVGNPFSHRTLARGEKVIDIGSGGGFDCFVARSQVGGEGQVVGIDMTEEMLAKSNATAKSMGFTNVEFRNGLIEDMDIEDDWADVVISNGVINLTTDKTKAFSEIARVLKPGGRLYLADIVVALVLWEGIRNDIDLWAA